MRYTDYNEIYYDLDFENSEELEALGRSIMEDLIAAGAPLKLDSIASYSSEGTGSTNGTGYEYVLTTCHAEFVDSLYNMNEGTGLSEANPKLFGFTMRFQSNWSYGELNVGFLEENKHPYDFFNYADATLYQVPLGPKLKMNYKKVGGSLFFGFRGYGDGIYNSPGTHCMNMCFTPIKSLSNPNEIVSHSFFMFVPYGYTYDGNFYCYGSYNCLLYPYNPNITTEYMRSAQSTDINRRIEASTTNKVELNPCMIGISDLYLERVYFSNVSKSMDEEEIVQLDKGNFLVVGLGVMVSPDFYAPSSVLFDISQN